MITRLIVRKDEISRFEECIASFEPSEIKVLSVEKEDNLTNYVWFILEHEFGHTLYYLGQMMVSKTG